MNRDEKSALAEQRQHAPRRTLKSKGTKKSDHRVDGAMVEHAPGAGREWMCRSKAQH